ncbi:serine/threonine protein kinase [Parabacteroides pacaensis]|uniref:serine/threonine protein kinase n=1 Tax=Parabacteroides pacaensis TaxID=2086575 RepID=UPI000D0FFB30|nr:serine/threonine-protein kinase [Parabacteroides pacaensis]
MNRNSLSIGTSLQEGKYRIEGVLGQGGFGITYLATMKLQIQGPLGMMDGEIKVAVKEFFMKELCNRDQLTSYVSVPSVGSQEVIERYRKKFIKEANNIAALQHKHIIKVIDVFEENQTAYYVMEYIEGCSLQEWIKTHGAMPEKEAVRCISQIASALDYIHQRYINHLDVKPGNILRKLDTNVVLIDFGLAKQYDPEGNQTSSTPIGVSAGYAPIEQSKPGGVGQFSAPTDIYSLGATLYKLLTGITPPDASDILNDGFPSLQSHMTPQLANAIEKAMQPSRGNRPQNIRQFMALLKGEGIKENEEDTVLLKKEIENEKEVEKVEVIETPVMPETDNHEENNATPLSHWLKSKSIFAIGILGNIGWWITTIVAILFLFPFVEGWETWQNLTAEICQSLGIKYYWGENTNMEFIIIGLLGIIFVFIGFYHSMTLFPDSIRKKSKYNTIIVPLLVFAPVWYYLSVITLIIYLFLTICLMMAWINFSYRKKYSLSNEKSNKQAIELLLYPVLFLVVSDIWRIGFARELEEFNIMALLGGIFLFIMAYRIQHVWKELPSLLTKQHA